MFAQVGKTAGRLRGSINYKVVVFSFLGWNANTAGLEFMKPNLSRG
jgi:hypothetical protein